MKSNAPTIAGKCITSDIASVTSVSQMMQFSDVLSYMYNVRLIPDFCQA